jgi:uncharacterized protein YdhG (YjbR/CyaY superfamily)
VSIKAILFGATGMVGEGVLHEALNNPAVSSILVIGRRAKGKLRQLRKAIREVAPAAEERISYGIPYYGYKGRLVYFAAFKKHIGLYVPGPVIEDHKRDLKGFEIAKSTVRFPLDKKLPIALIKKLVRARKKLNEARREH